MSAVAPERVAIVNLGCKVNQAELEAAARGLRALGSGIVGPDRRADLVIVNTCTVTATADAKSRPAVRRARRASPDARLVVTGCSAAVEPAAFARIDPAAEIAGNHGKTALLAELAALRPRGTGQLEAGGRGDPGAEPGALPTLSGVEPVRAIDGVGDDRTLADRTRAFVKVQDGCSFFCTYCLIPRARGAERSIPPEAVLADIRRAVAAGHREIVLTGINIGTYDGGWSEPGPRRSHRRAATTLAGLVRRILAETEVERVRISSIEPQHVDDELLTAWAEGAPRTLPHLHLPLQSGDDGVLRRMGRRYDAAGYAGRVAAARAALPGLAVHADVIVGFPTEDEVAFERTADLVRALGLAGLHVFRYSERPGTAATRMAGTVPEPVRRERSATLLALAATLRAARAAERVGATASVLFEARMPDGRWLGHAEDHVLVAAAAPDRRPLENAIARAALSGIDAVAPDRLAGRLLEVSHGRALHD